MQSKKSKSLQLHHHHFPNNLIRRSGTRRCLRGAPYQKLQPRVRQLLLRRKEMFQLLSGPFLFMFEIIPPNSMNRPGQTNLSLDLTLRRLYLQLAEP